MKRRDFIKYTVCGMTALWVGSKLPPWAPKEAQALDTVAGLDFTITDAVKEMYTHQGPFVVGDGQTPFDLVNFPQSGGNQALQYYWIYKSNIPDLPADSPGPLIFTKEGATIPISVTNALDAPHRLSIPGIGFTTGNIAPGATFTGTINVPANSAGTYLYFDDLNAPVNRVMGLHGAFVVMPNPPNGTPFSAARLTANPKLAQLFSDLGSQPWWPGLAWDEGGSNGPGFPPTPPFRQFIWLVHEASPLLFAAVGDNADITFTDIFGNVISGPARDPSIFIQAFLNSRFDPAQFNQSGSNEELANDPAVRGYAPQYFTVSGQTGHFSHDSPFITPHLRVGEPCLIRCLNAGLWTHCLHLHANHFYMLRVRNEQTGVDTFGGLPDLSAAQIPGVEDNHLWLDVFGAHPMDVWEYLVPYMRPPDVPNTLGIGRADLSQPLPVIPDPLTGGFGPGGGNTPAGVTTWPPVQEINMHIPKVGFSLTVPRLDSNGNLVFVDAPAHMHLSPLCYPMHDHSEPTQTSQGGNYNTGLMSGMNFIGDRNADGKLPAPPAGSGITVGSGGVFTFHQAPLAFEEARPADVPEAGNPDNQDIVAALGQDYLVRSIFGADPELTGDGPVSVQPPGGPRQPFEEAD